MTKTKLKKLVCKTNNHFLIDPKFSDESEERLAMFTRFEKELPFNQPSYEKITISKHKFDIDLTNAWDRLKLDKTRLPHQLSNIGDAFIQNFCNQLLSIWRDPFKVAHLLQNLDQNLGNKMQDLGVSFDESDKPQYLIASKCFFLPGPPKEGRVARKKHYALDKILLEREMKCGINSEGFSAKFIGGVDPKIASDFVSSGHIFSEDDHVDNFLTHGKYSHRLQFEIIRQACETGLINTHADNLGRQLTQLEILQMINDVHTVWKSGDTTPLWVEVIDNFRDSGYRRERYPIRLGPIKLGKPQAISYENEELFEIENYSFSSRNPDVLNSLILCFGEDLQLPNLAAYLRDSHWKVMDQITTNAEIAGANYNIPNSDLYTLCSKAFRASYAGTSNFAHNILTTNDQDRLAEKTSYLSVPGVSSDKIKYKKRDEKFLDATSDEEGLAYQESAEVEDGSKIKSSIPNPTVLSPNSLQALTLGSKDDDITSQTEHCSQI